MSRLTDAVGHAVFIRTDVPEYLEEAIAFASLEEMVAVCTTPQKNLTLEKVTIYASDGQNPISLNLAFVAASRGRRMPVELEKVLVESQRRVPEEIENAMKKARGISFGPLS